MTAPVIAVLDNDPSFLSLMHDLLTDEGYRTLRWHASEWARAHTLLRRLQPHLVILDLIEPLEDGWAFLKRLWGDVETTHIPAVIVTREPESLPVQADVLHALHCQVVRKPFDLPDLLAAIAALLGPSPVQWEHGARAPTAVVDNPPMNDTTTAYAAAADADAADGDEGSDDDTKTRRTV
jgi:DNA-binding response OmpR family regulator